MPGTFFGLNTALRGLEAQQTAMDVTSHNIANASTPGYSRQSVDLQTTAPFYAPSLFPAGAGQIGTGVEVLTIGRAHDDFIQQQITYQNQSQSQQQSFSNALDQVSQVYNDPSNQGFSNLLSKYFTSWQQLSNNPSDGPSRAVVAAQGATLAAGFNAAATSLQTMQSDQNRQVVSDVQQINTITGQISALNQQITSVIAAGQQPNDLLDQRDQLIGSLSQLADIQYHISNNGTANVSLVGGGSLVQGVNAFQLATTPNTTNPQFSNVVFQGQTAPLALTGGQLGGALQVRDVTLAGQLTKLNTLAANVMSAVNNIETSTTKPAYDSNGNPGVAFFTGTSAATMQVNAAITADPSRIAASGSIDPITGKASAGDGSIALAIGDLQQNPAAGQTATLQSQYQNIISQLGVDMQQAHANVQTGGLVLQNLHAQQSSVSSVSLDEEATNLIQYQHAYQAAAHVISIFDQTIGDMIRTIGG